MHTTQNTPTAESEPKSWLYPKDSKIRIQEVINKCGKESYGQSFQVTVPAKWTGQGRLRKRFDKLEDAERFADEQHHGKMKLGEEFFEISALDRRNAMSALNSCKEHRIEISKVVRETIDIMEMLRPHENLTLKKAVEFAIPRMRPKGGDKTVGDVVKEMVASKQTRFNSGQLRNRSFEDFRQRANRFSEDFADRMIKELGHEEIKKWVADMKLSTRSNRNYLSVLSEIFRFSTQRKYVFSSPLNDFSDDDLKELVGNGDSQTEPSILTPEEAKHLLNAALQNSELDLLAAVTLALFAGLRTEEIKKLSWDNVFIDSKEPEKSFVRVPWSIAKKRRNREVTIPTNALQWLALCLNRKGQVTRNDYSSDYRKRFEKLQKLAGFGKTDSEGKWISTWKVNGMRHSFGSYHYALHQNSLETARLMGHKQNDDVLFGHYRALATKEKGEAYFNLLPPEGTGQIIAFPKTAVA